MGRCTIAELFLEGTPLFTFSQLLRYQRNEYDPIMILEKIENEDLKALIRSMIQLDPNARLSVKDYLENWRDILFPECFYSYFHSFISRLNNGFGNSFESTLYGSSDMDNCISCLWQEYPTMVEWICKSNDQNENDQNGHQNEQNEPIPLLPLNLDSFQIKKSCTYSNIYILTATIVCSCIRNIQYVSNKLKALDLLLVYGQNLTDEDILDRLIPYIICLIDDPSPLVRSHALKTLTLLVI